MTEQHQILIQSLIIVFIRARAIESLAEEKQDIAALIQFENDFEDIFSL